MNQSGGHIPVYQDIPEAISVLFLIRNVTSGGATNYYDSLTIKNPGYCGNSVSFQHVKL